MLSVLSEILYKIGMSQQFTFGTYVLNLSVVEHKDLAEKFLVGALAQIELPIKLTPQQKDTILALIFK